MRRRRDSETTEAHETRQSDIEGKHAHVLSEADERRRDSTGASSSSVGTGLISSPSFSSPSTPCASVALSPGVGDLRPRGPCTLNFLTFRSAEDNEEDARCVAIADTDAVRLVIPECASSELGSFLWPSSLLLAEYVQQRMRAELQGKTVIELGSGRCLNGIHCALLGCRRVILTDADPAVLRDAVDIRRINGLTAAQVDIQRLEWGTFDAATEQLRTGNSGAVDATGTVTAVSSRVVSGVDLLLGADVLYDPRDFDAVLATVCYFDCPLLTVYQHRGEGMRRLRELCRKWHLTLERLPPVAPTATLQRSHRRSDPDSEEGSRSAAAAATVDAATFTPAVSAISTHNDVNLELLRFTPSR